MERIRRTCRRQDRPDAHWAVDTTPRAAAASILIATRVPEDYCTPNDRGKASIARFLPTRAITRRDLEQALRSKPFDALVVSYRDPVDRDLLRLAPALRIVATLSKGTDHIDVEACERRAIRVVNAPGILGGVVAEFVVLLILMSLRNLHRELQDRPNDEWHFTWNCDAQTLESQTVGIFGFGETALRLTEMLQPFGCRILYHSRKRKPAFEARYGIEYREFDSLLADSSIVIPLCSLNADTARRFDRTAFQRMQAGSTFINVSRGGVCDHRALADALRGHLRQALLDVTDPEPLPADHPLRTAANCRITNHIATNTIDSRRAIFRCVMDQALALLTPRAAPAWTEALGDPSGTQTRKGIVS